MALQGQREMDLFSELLAVPSPSGREERLAAVIAEKIRRLGYEPEIDGAHNITVRVNPMGSEDGAMILAAHSDEIGAVVTGINPDGSLRVDRSGGLTPTKIGESPVEIVGDGDLVRGVLSQGSGHTQAASSGSLEWKEVRVITGLAPAQLAERGVRAGSTVVPARFLCGPMIFGDAEDPLVAAWTFDDRMGCVALLRLLEEIRESSIRPPRPLLVCFTVHEEGGCHGANVVATLVEFVQSAI